jgi:hypothetical protein
MASKRSVPEHGQAALILDAFAAYLGASPGRCVVLSKDANGWRVSLEDARTTRGTSLVDAAAQAATAVMADAGAT